jgi:hypothetical protein
MQKSYHIYNNLGYWFLLFIVLIVAGFYKSYFAVISNPFPTIIHVHFTAMMVWTLILIVQPFLIKNKKLAWHRAIGKFSFVFFPVMILVNFLMLRFVYYRELNNAREESLKAVVPITESAILQKAAYLSSIVVYYIFFLIVFYSLAVFNRKKSAIHARYIVATSLTLLGPTVDRIIFFWFNLEILPGGIPIFTVAFLIADLVLLLLLWKDYSRKKPTRTLATALGLYIAGQILYFVFQDSQIFSHVMAFIMKPAP